MQVLLISTYEMGRQPFGLASPAAWLHAGGHSAFCADLSLGPLPAALAASAGLAAIYLPMHTATRLAAPVVRQIRELNPAAHLCCYGLYAPLNEAYLRELGVQSIFGGEFEPALLGLANQLARGEQPTAQPLISLDRLPFLTPDRSSLPPPASYVRLQTLAGPVQTGYTEATRGCKHRCRHCPVVPVYNGAFRVVQPDIVLADIQQQIEAGARHITFGDPDFLNAPTHAARIVQELHRRFPGVTYDATIKVEHLLHNPLLVPTLRDTGCLFVTTAVESLDDAVLAKLEKGHTRRDFLHALDLCRHSGLTLSPTFIAFTPWTSPESYRDFLASLLHLGLAETIAPIQLALRLLIPAGSRMLELAEIQALLEGFDAPALLHRWKHPDPAVDRMAAEAMKVAAQSLPRAELFRAFWNLAHETPLPEDFGLIPRAAVPYLDEPWYC